MPDFPISRRQAMGTLAAGASIGVPAAAKAGATAASAWDFIVVGAGVFGAWPAWNLQRRGHNTLLLDAWGAAPHRASSGGEPLPIRTAYSAHHFSPRWARDSLAEWTGLSPDRA